MTHHLPLDAVFLDPVDPHTDDEAVADTRQRRLILIAMCVSLIAVIASSSALNVAQQALAADIGACPRQDQVDQRQEGPCPAGCEGRHHGR